VSACLALTATTDDRLKDATTWPHKLELLRTIPSALVGALVVITVLPEFPPTRNWTNRLRQFARALALYPDAMLRLSRRLVWRADGNVDVANATFERELARYGISTHMLRQWLSPSVYRDLLEIQFVRDEFGAFVQDINAKARRGFVTSRAAALEIAERNYQTLVRRAAHVCVLGDFITVIDDEPYPLSDLIAYRTTRLLRRYRRLISEAALSCYPTGARRKCFIESFGYAAPSDWLLPYWPLVAIFALDSLLFVLPILLHSVPILPSQNLFGVFALFLLGHGIAQVFAVAWAILPKTESNFARPSPYSYPWRSYLLFGGLSYASGAALTLLIDYAAAVSLESDHQTLPTVNGIDPYSLAFVFCAYFPVTTICVSFLTDLHLRHRTYRWWLYRARDATVTAVALGATNLLIRGGIWFLSGHGPPTWAFLWIVIALGLVIGALIPGSAVPYLLVPDETESVNSRGKDVVRKAEDNEVVGVDAYHT
jgi:hypothetical protein